ncbi:MAG: peptide deformylase [Marinilabiliales bacterium]
MFAIYTYGNTVLRKKAEEISKDYKDLDSLIENMYNTMYSSEGVGLAAPQIGKSIRLFIVDGSPMSDDDESLKDFKKVFINPQIIEESGDFWTVEEGCLSVPGIREEVKRKSKIRIQYFDQNFNYFDEVYDGLKARIIQHEYDHLEGILFIDKINPLRKKMIRSKLNNILKGKVDVKYKVKFAIK